MFVLVISTACSLFLAVSTGSQAMFYAFLVAGLSLFGYVWMLAQKRQGEVAASTDAWPATY